MTLVFCRYCKKEISDKDMAMTDGEKKVYGGGARFLGYTDPPSAIFAHEDCCKEKEKR